MRNNQNGQILLVILLIMIVGLTIGLFLLGRTTTDISLTTKITDSTRAFNAAEAGIEEAIRTPGSFTGASSSPVLVATGVTYTVGASGLGAAGSYRIYPETKQETVPIGSVFTVWLVGHDTSGNLDELIKYNFDSVYICFTTNSPLPSLGVTMIYRDNANLIRSSYKGYDSPGRSTTGFEPALNATATDCPTTDYNFYASVQFSTDFSNSPLASPFTPLAIRIRPLYAPASIAVRELSPGMLPFQGSDITSVGNVGEITRRINVKKPYTVPPPFIDYALYSTGINAPLTHN